MSLGRALWNSNSTMGNPSTNAIPMHLPKVLSEPSISKLQTLPTSMGGVEVYAPPYSCVPLYWYLWTNKVTKKGPLVLPSNSTLKAAIPEVWVKVHTNWTQNKTDWDSSQSGNLAEEISLFPLPAGWEARRTKHNDVYFINSEKGQSTACLWREMVPGNDTSTKLSPLPEGWTVSRVNGKVAYYKSSTLETTETPPQPDDKSTFQNVIKSKEYCQLLEFFPQYLIDQYEKDAKRTLVLAPTALPRPQRRFRRWFRRYRLGAGEATYTSCTAFWAFDRKISMDLANSWPITSKDRVYLKDTIWI